MTDTPVSVIIPTYNRADTIEEAVESLLSQSHAALEIIVVDDGSTDDTAGRLERFSGRIRFVRKPNGGCATARNIGLEHASGRYIAWMDSDDVCLPDRIALQAIALDSLEQAVLVSCDFSSMNAVGEVLEQSHICSYYSTARQAGGAAKLYDAAMPVADGTSEARPTYVGNCYEKLIWGNFIHPPTVMVRRDALERCGGFDPEVPYNAEYDCIIRVARQGPCLYIDSPLLLYRYTDAQMSGSPTLWKVKENTARIMRKVVEQDPDLARMASVRLKERIAVNLADAAYLRANGDRREAWRLLRESIAEGGVSRRVLRATARLLAPEPAIEGIRRWRRMRDPIRQQA